MSSACTVAVVIVVVLSVVEVVAGDLVMVGVFIPCSRPMVVPDGDGRLNWSMRSLVPGVKILG